MGHGKYCYIGKDYLVAFVETMEEILSNLNSKKKTKENDRR